MSEIQETITQDTANLNEKPVNEHIEVVDLPNNDVGILYVSVQFSIANIGWPAATSPISGTFIKL